MKQQMGEGESRKNQLTYWSLGIPSVLPQYFRQCLLRVNLYTTAIKPNLGKKGTRKNKTEKVSRQNETGSKLKERDNLTL